MKRSLFLSTIFLYGVLLGTLYLLLGMSMPSFFTFTGLIISVLLVQVSSSTIGQIYKKNTNFLFFLARTVVTSIVAEIGFLTLPFIYTTEITQELILDDYAGIATFWIIAFLLIISITCLLVSLGITLVIWRYKILDAEDTKFKKIEIDSTRP
ncbi:MAG: hypothetical protein MK212_09270 [Saprospiraceae bacterium]|nr:hypothetical protein [Saprospiraceae bacterium]